MESDPESWSGGSRISAGLISRAAHGLESSGQGECVAMGAARADPIASSDRVPSRLRPLDSTVVSHR